MPPKKKKGDKKSSKGKGKNDKAKEEEDLASFDLLLTNFKKFSILITGESPPPLVYKTIKGPSQDKGADEEPGWYDAKHAIQVVDIILGPALCRALCRSILGHGMIHKETLQPLSYQLLTRITLCGCNIGDSGMTALCEVLTAGETLGVRPTVLELAACDITHVGCEHLGLALSGGSGGNTSLLKISLDHNKKLGNRGLQSLCIGLRGNSTLTSLSVRCCGLEGQGMATAVALLLSSTTTGLEHLELSDNCLTPM